MIKYIIKRILNLIPVLLIISILLFGLTKIMPGDPAQMMVPATIKDAEERQRMIDIVNEKYGFNKSIPEQYVGWLTKTLTGELGWSTKYQRPVTTVLWEPIRNTLILNLGATLIAFILSIIIGIKSAVNRGGFFDKFFQVFSLAGISLPTFFIAMLLIYTFALRWKVLPGGGMPRNDELAEWIKYLILPTLTLMVGSLASTSRYVRNSMIDALSMDYIKTARAKGVSERRVIYRHAFRNALIPVVTVVAWSITGLLSGAAITETIFAYKGIGKYFIESILARDYNTVMALNMMYALLSVFGNLLMDIGYSLVDPRVRLE